MKDKEVRDAETRVPDAETLAKAWRKSPGFGSPYWYEGEWVWLSPHGDSHSRCGSPVPPPAPDEIKPHQRQLWARCKICNAIKPWGGCGSKSFSSTYNTTWQGK